VTLDQLWTWATDLAQSSKAQSPLALHSQSGDRDGWEWDKAAKPEQAIRGLPFTRGFERYVDRELPRSVKDALKSLRPTVECAVCDSPRAHAAHRQGQYAMWTVCKAVVQRGISDREACRRQLGLSEFAFQVSATNGLLALKSAIENAA
jgi:hypothetical protein